MGPGQGEKRDMAISLAFSTVACPEWTLERVAEQAAAMGYEGVELRTLGAGATQLACDPAQSDPEKVGHVFKAHGVKPVCLSTSVVLYERNQVEAKGVQWQVTQSLDQAAAMGCPFVRVFGAKAGVGEDLRTVIGRTAERVGPLAEHAASVGVSLLLENAGGMATAKPWWWLLEVVGHPMVGLAWNAATAAAAGEPAGVSVPMLNSRIKLAKVKDTRLGEGSGYAPLGEGTVGIELFVQRLMGVGYEGWISVEWDRLWLRSLAAAEEYLPEALKRLRGWIESATAAVEKGRAAAAKAAAKNAPKPRAALAGQGAKA